VEEIMKKFAAALAFVATLSTGAAFAQDAMQNTYGNTVVVTYANGAEARYFFNQDGTFTGVAPGGSTMAGRWAIQEEQLCLMPPSGQAPTCTPLAGEKNVGDTWQQTGADGSQITVTLQAGR
jgi:hypothetical protein